MTEPDHDRAVELVRYNARAARLLAPDAQGPDGADGIELPLRRPYLRYEELLRREVRQGSRVLDLCCGDGIHSIYAARLGGEVTATDIAERNLAATGVRATRAGVRLTTLVADAEKLPMQDGTFDVVTCVGSLSYVQLELLLGEVLRVLRPGGAFIFVDSLNHNPVYRFNRWIRYRRGQRSRSTLLRMPTRRTLARIRRQFRDLEVSYHGVFSFLVPILRPFGPARAARWLDAADERLPNCLRSLAFKIVGIGHKPVG